MNAEPLEERRLLSTVVVINHVLTVTGNSDTANNIFVIYSADKSNIILKINGKEKHVSSNDITGLSLIGGDQPDQIRISNVGNQFDIESTLIGGAGDDTLIGGDGHNLEIGGNGDDILVGGALDDTLVGGRGNDTIYCGAASDLIFGGEGNDSIVGGAGFDIIFGGNGDDIIKSGNNLSELFGNGGNNYLRVAGGDTVYAGGGNDTVVGSVGSSGQLSLGEYPHLSKILGQLDPKVDRFHDATGRRADTSPLL